MPSAPLDRSAVVGRLRAAGCVFAEAEAELLMNAAGTPGELGRLVDRRCAGTPVEQVVGWAEFCGLRIGVDTGVFVPRRRSEHLVRQAVLVTPPAGVVVDMCCGTGAVGVALATAVGGVDLHAVDVDAAAVRCARRNVEPVGGQVYHGDGYAPLPSGLLGRVDVIVANAPYVPTSEIRLLPPEARDHEALVALDGGPDGVDVQRRVAAAAGDWLAPGGHLLIETSDRQADATMTAVARAGLRARLESCGDLQASVVIGS
jgi:release factor glutamine methyltransferase